MLYVAVDSYLREKGKLGFLITQTIFKTKGAGDGFRRFRYGSTGTRMSVFRVDDFSSFNPFEDASNWSSAIFLERDGETKMPVPYYSWQIRDDISPTEVVPEKYKRQLSVQREEAWPVDRRIPTSPWMTSPEGVSSSIQKAIGKADYSAHAGAYSGGANGVFWVEILRDVSPQEVLVRNLVEKAKKKVEIHERSVERDLLYPLLRWKDVARWQAGPAAYTFLTQDPSTRSGIAEEAFRKSYPKAFDYFAEFKPVLLARKSKGLAGMMESSGFYCMFSVSTATLSPDKVVWRRMDRRMSAAVVSEVQDKFLGRRPCIPQETCVFVACSSDDEAHYLCAIMNSALVDFIAQSYNVRGGKGFGSPSLLQFVKVPKFQSTNPLHLNLMALSRECHNLAVIGNGGKLQSTEDAIAESAAKLWDIPYDELRAIRATLVDSESLRHASVEEEDVENGVA